MTFSPTATGPQTATLTISSDDPDESALEVALSGNGVHPPDISVTPLSIYFGDLPVGDSSGYETVEVSNNGLGALDGYLYYPPSAFDLDTGTCGHSIHLAAAGFCTFGVAFAPTEAGPVSGVVEISSNDPDKNPFLLYVSGVGVPPGDSDADGVTDTEEQGPDGTDSSYDGNDDGTPDREQDNVASL